MRDFENLRVFAKRNQIVMDELVQDLTTALEESATGTRSNNLQAMDGAECNSKTLPKRYVKKRRGIRRSSSNNLYWNRGTISEASESSVDETGRDPVRGVIHSDSDDLSSCRIPKLALSMVDVVPPVESDSFTENLSPLRPQRRRRKFRSMAIDASPIPSDSDSLQSSVKALAIKGTDKNVASMAGPDKQQFLRSTPVSNNSMNAVSYSVMSGKRKRGCKNRSEFTHPSSQNSYSGLALSLSDRMDVGNASQ